MTTRTAIARIATGAILGAALVAGTAPAAFAAPGDWTQLSQTSSAARYPEVGNIAEPSMARFGGALQVLWGQQQSSSRQAYYSAILDGNGRVTTPAAQAFEWDALTKNPTLISLGGQRFLSFSGLNPGRSGAQYFATSGDGLTWSVSNGSMSETQSAYAAYGSDAIDNAGTPVWVGNAGSTSGIRWHIGTSDVNPAPAGTDQQFSLGGCCAYNAAAARDEATGVVYAAFYSNSSATTEEGIQVGRIIPGPGAFSQAPGSVTTNDYGTNSSDPDQQVAMAARAGGGVYVAYKMGYPSTKSIRILRVDTGATLDFPVSGNVRSVSMGADPAGRIWVVWNQDNRMRAVHTNRAGSVLGSIGAWGAPRGTDTMWKTTTSGSEGGADVVVTATTQSAINVWHTQIERTLTVSADPGSVRRGGRVTFSVTDAGDPVAGATVRFGSRTGRTNASGKATIAAPGARGTARAKASKAGYNGNLTAVRVR
jgi:hypothetical protein